MLLGHKIQTIKALVAQPTQKQHIVAVVFFSLVRSLRLIVSSVQLSVVQDRMIRILNHLQSVVSIGSNGNGHHFRFIISLGHVVRLSE